MSKSNAVAMKSAVLPAPSAAATHRRGKVDRRHAPVTVTARQETYMNRVLHKVAKQLKEEMGSDAEIMSKLHWDTEQDAPKVRLSAQAKSVLSDLMGSGVIARVIRNANAVALYNNKRTVSDRHLIYGVRVMIPDENVRDNITHDCVYHAKKFKQSYPAEDKE